MTAAACLLSIALPSASGAEGATGGLAADPAYGGDGTAEMAATCGDPSSLEADGPAGQFYVLVQCGRRLQVAALGSDGEPLPGFGAAGVAQVPRPARWGHLSPVGLVVDASGRITVGLMKLDRFEDYSSDTAVIRLQPDGSADQGFGQGGIAVIPGKRVGVMTEFMAVDPRGRTVVLRQNDSERFKMTRLRSNGSVDRRFGSNGRVLGSVSDRRVKEAEPRALVMDGATPYVVTDATVPWKPGWVRPAVAVVRITRHGRIDQRFGKRNGRAVVPLPTSGSGATIDGVVDARGRLIVAALDQNDADTRTWTLVRRLTSTGRVDRRFARHAGTILARGPESLESLGLVGQRPVVVLTKPARSGRDIAQVHGFTATGRPWLALGAGGVASVPASGRDYNDWSSISSAGLYRSASCYCADPIQVQRFVTGPQ